MRQHKDRKLEKNIELIKWHKTTFFFLKTVKKCCLKTLIIVI